MAEHTEWEIVEAPGPGPRQTGSQQMKSMLGRHWKFKVAGMALAGAAILVFALMLTGVVVALMAGTIVLSVTVAKLRQLLRKSR